MQTIFTSIFLLAAGFALLIKGADFFVDGSSSLPELVTSIVAAKKNELDIAVGNGVVSLWNTQSGT